MKDKFQITSANRLHHKGKARALKPLAYILLMPVCPDITKSEFEGRFKMEKFEYKVVTYDTKGFWGGNVEVHQIENQLNLLGSEG